MVMKYFSLKSEKRAFYQYIEKLTGDANIERKKKSNGGINRAISARLTKKSRCVPAATFFDLETWGRS